jgi:cell division protein FtsB
METYEEGGFQESENRDLRMPPNRWLGVGFIALLVATGIATGYGFHERNEVRQLTEQSATAQNATSQLQAQVNTLTARLNELTVAQATNAAARPAAPSPNNEVADLTPPPGIDATAPSAAPALAIAPTTKPATPKTTVKHRPAVDKHYAQLKAQLDDQQKQLKETQDAVAKNREELEGSINSTRDELNGSIAKTHDELVALEKRGERNYYEFDLTKSKQFQRVGPMSLSLRKTDTKHKSYDLTMLVDDNELSKKKVNLYEPVWIHMENGGQPVQVVVNRIDQNGVHGYVSAPKYKVSELPTLSSSSQSAPDNGSQQNPH